MKAYELFFDDVMPELPGAETALVLHHIKRMANDFYERSLYSREDLTPINVVANTATYSVASGAPTDFDVGKILTVRLNMGSAHGPKPLPARSKQQLNIDMPDWSTSTGTPKFYLQDAIDSLTLAKIPDASYTGGLLVKIAKLPKYDGAGIDDHVWSKFSESMAQGVKARMMRIQKKPWSNPGLAADYMREYNVEVAAAAAIAAKDFGGAPLRTRACP